MPGTVLYTCSCGSTRNCLPDTTELRSFSSRYKADAWYSLFCVERLDSVISIDV